MEATVAQPQHGAGLLALPAIDAPRLCLLLLCVALVAMAFLKGTDPDYWWHLKTGELIADFGSVPRSDPYSFTAEGKPWVAHEWLSELIIYRVQSLAGYAANVALFSAIGLAALLVAYGVAFSYGVSRWAAVGLFAWVGIMSQPYWFARPQVITWLLFAVFISILLEHYRGGRNRLWLLPPLMVAWANLHLGYAFGLAAVGLYVVSLVAERYFWHNRRDLNLPAMALATCILATLITPHPGELLLYPLSYLQPGNAGVRLIEEWQSPDFHSASFIPMALAILTLVGLGVVSRQRGLFLTSLALVFTFLVLHSVRNQPLFAIVFAIAVAAALAERWPWTWGRHDWTEPGRSHDMLNTSLILVVVVMAATFLARVPSAQLHRQPNQANYPVAGAEYIRQNYPQARLFNDYGWGGFLINALYPQKVFIDGRSDFYGDALLETYHDVLIVQGNWQAIFDRYAFDVVIVQHRTPLSARLDAAPETWQRVFSGPIESVFVRTDYQAP